MQSLVYLKNRNDPLIVYKTELQEERVETVVGIDKGNIFHLLIYLQQKFGREVE